MDRLLSMRVFQSVVDEGGFAAGARALDMSAPVVTRLISDLEAHLKVRLMNRTTRRMALTEAGQAFLVRVRSILREVDDAEAEASASAKEMSGTVRVVATPMLAALLLAPVMQRWHQRQPGVTIEIIVDPFPQDHLQEFDLSLFAVDEGFDADVVARPLLVSDYVVCASPDYLKRHGHPKVPADLERHAYLRFPWQSELGAVRKRLRLRRANDAAGTTESAEVAEVQMPIVLESLSLMVLQRAAIEGAGVAVLSKLLIAPELQAGQLVQLLPDWIFGRFTAYVAMPSREFVPRRSRAFLDLLHESIASRQTVGAPR